MTVKKTHQCNRCEKIFKDDEEELLKKLKVSTFIPVKSPYWTEVNIKMKIRVDTEDIHYCFNCFIDASIEALKKYQGCFH